MADNPGGGKPPPTTDELRKMVPDWNLAGDKNLLHVMESMHENMMQNLKSVNGKIDNLISDLDTASISLQNVNNRFNGLSNTQFIENRVYDDDDEVMVSGKAEKNTEEIIPKVHKDNNKEESLLDAKEREMLATSKSLQVLESYYEEIQIVPDSDSESGFSADEVQLSDSIVLQPKNLYADQPLPHIIGSIQWNNKWHVGLVNEESDSDSEDETGVKHEDLSSTDSEGVYARHGPGDHTGRGLVEARNTAQLGTQGEAEVQTSDDLGSDTDSENFLNHSRSVNRRNLETSKVAGKPTIGAKPPSTRTASDFAAELAKKLRGASGGTEAPLLEDEGDRRQSAPSSAKNGPEFKSRFSEKPAERIVGRVFFDEPPPLDSHDNAETDNLFGGNDTDCEPDDLFADIHNPTNLFGPSHPQSSSYGGLFDNLGEKGGAKSEQNNKDDIFGSSFESKDGDKGLFSSASKAKSDIGGENKAGGLFDDILDEEEDDLFGPKSVGERTMDLVGKIPYKQPTTKASSNLFDNDLEDDAALFETSAKPPAPEQPTVNKKPIGGVSMLGNQNANITDVLKQRRKPSSSSESNESDMSATHKEEPMPPHDRPLPPKPVPKTMDIPVTKKTTKSPVTNKIADLLVTSKSTESKKSKNEVFSDENDIFADDNLFFSNGKTEARATMKSDNLGIKNMQNDMKSQSLFDDLSDDENSLFGQPTKKTSAVKKSDSDGKRRVADVVQGNNLDKLASDNYEHDNSLFAKCDSRNVNKIKDNETVISKTINDRLVNDNSSTGEQGEKSVISYGKSSLNEAGIASDSDKFQNIESELSNDTPNVNEQSFENDLTKAKTIAGQSQIEQNDYIFAVKEVENSIFEDKRSNFDDIFGESKVTSNERRDTDDSENALFGTNNGLVETSIFLDEPPDFDHVVEDSNATDVNDLFGEGDEDYYTAFKSSKSFLDDLPSGTGTSKSGYDFLTDEPPDLDEEAFFGDIPRRNEGTKVSTETSIKAVPQFGERDEFSSTENLFASSGTNVSKNFDSIFKESDDIFGSSKVGKSSKLFGDMDSDSDDIFGIPKPPTADTTPKATAKQPETQNQMSETPDIVEPVVAKRKEMKESQNVTESPVKTKAPKPSNIPVKPDIINVKPKILNKAQLIENKPETPKSDATKSESEIDGANVSSRKSPVEPSASKSVGKLKINNLNINVNTLKPGASPKKSAPSEKTISDTTSPKTISKSPEKTNADTIVKPNSEARNSLPKSISFEAEPESPELSNAISKERARIQVKRRPPSRKARKDALRKSALNLDVTDGFSIPHDSEADNFTYSLPNSPQSVLDESSKAIGTFEKQFCDIIGIKKGEQSTENDNSDASSMDEPKVISTLGSVYQNVGEGIEKSSNNYKELNESFSDDDELFKKGCKSKESKQNIVDRDVKPRSESTENGSVFDEKVDVTPKFDKEVDSLSKANVSEEKTNSTIEINYEKNNTRDGSKYSAKTNLEDSNDEDNLFKTKTSDTKKSETSEQTKLPASKDPFDEGISLFKTKSELFERSNSESLFKTDSEKVERKSVDSDDDFLFNPKPKNVIVKTDPVENIKSVITRKINSELTHDKVREPDEEELFKPQPKLTENQPIAETEKSLSEKSEKPIPTENTNSEIGMQSEREADLFKPKTHSPSDAIQKPKQENTKKQNSEPDDEEDLFGAKPKIPNPLPDGDIFGTKKTKESDPKKKQQNSIFQDLESDDDLFSGIKVNKNLPKIGSAKEKLPASSVANPSTIFGDEEDSLDDLFSGNKKSTAFSKGYEKTKPLFRETNDEHDMFGLSTSSRKSKSSKSSNSNAAVSTKKAVQSVPSSAEQVFQDPLSLFDED